MSHPPRTDEGSQEFYIDPETPALSEALNAIQDKVLTILPDRIAVLKVTYQSQKV